MRKPSLRTIITWSAIAGVMITTGLFFYWLRQHGITFEIIGGSG